jgi:hypothetical protein
MAIDNSDREALVKQAERVQALLLADFEQLLKSGELHPTDRATIARFLKDNNFRVDANTLPSSLQDLVSDIHSRRKNGTPRIMPDPSVV